METEYSIDNSDGILGNSAVKQGENEAHQSILQSLALIHHYYNFKQDTEFTGWKKLLKAKADEKHLYTLSALPKNYYSAPFTDILAKIHIHGHPSLTTFPSVFYFVDHYVWLLSRSKNYGDCKCFPCLKLIQNNYTLFVAQTSPSKLIDGKLTRRQELPPIHYRIGEVLWCPVSFDGDTLKLSAAARRNVQEDYPFLVLSPSDDDDEKVYTTISWPCVVTHRQALPPLDPANYYDWRIIYTVHLLNQETIFSQVDQALLLPFTSILPHTFPEEKDLCNVLPTHLLESFLDIGGALDEAEKISSTYTVFGPHPSSRQFPCPSPLTKLTKQAEIFIKEINLKTHYNGIYLGAEVIRLGDFVRLKYVHKDYPSALLILHIQYIYNNSPPNTKPEYIVEGTPYLLSSSVIPLDKAINSPPTLADFRAAKLKPYTGPSEHKITTNTIVNALLPLFTPDETGSGRGFSIKEIEGRYYSSYVACDDDMQKRNFVHTNGKRGIGGDKVRASVGKCNLEVLGLSRRGDAVCERVDDADYIDTFNNPASVDDDVMILDKNDDVMIVDKNVIEILSESSSESGDESTISLRKQLTRIRAKKKSAMTTTFVIEEEEEVIEECQVIDPDELEPKLPNVPKPTTESTPKKTNIFITPTQKDPPPKFYTPFPAEAKEKCWMRVQNALPFRGNEYREVMKVNLQRFSKVRKGLGRFNMTVMENPNSWPFRKSVKKSLPCIIKWFEGIQRIVDLNEIQGKLNSKCKTPFKTINEYFNDVELLFFNWFWVTGNAGDDLMAKEIDTLANKVILYFEREFRKFLDITVKGEKIAYVPQTDYIEYVRESNAIFLFKSFTNYAAESNIVPKFATAEGDDATSRTDGGFKPIFNY